MECWNIGVLGFRSITPLLHHSIIPVSDKLTRNQSSATKPMSLFLQSDKAQSKNAPSKPACQSAMDASKPARNSKL